MNLTDIRTEVEARGFDYLSADRIDTLANFYYHDICRRFPWPFLHVTASGTAPLSITDFGHALSVVDTTADTILQWEDKRTLREQDPGLDGTGNPSCWYLDVPNNQLEVYPVNTTNTIVVDYVKVPEDLVDGTDETLIPSRFQYVLVEGIVCKAYRDDDEIDLSDAARMEYEDGLTLMRDELLVPNYDGPTQIAEGPFGTSSSDW